MVLRNFPATEDYYKVLLVIFITESRKAIVTSLEGGGVIYHQLIIKTTEWLLPAI